MSDNLKKSEESLEKLEVDKTTEKNADKSPNEDSSKKDSSKNKAVKKDSSSVKKESEKKSNIFQTIVLFVRQIIDEMKKVVTPTVDELKEYSIVVVVFVLVIMLFITGVDFVIGKSIMALFGAGK